VITFKLQNMTIKQKLTAIIMFTSAVILLLAITIFIIWGQIEARRQLVIDLNCHAAMIADNCKASLAFSDKEDAEQILSALHARGSIVFACVYDKQGQVFVEYQRKGITEKIRPSEPQDDSHAFEHGYLSLFHQIKLDGEMVGTVYLRDDMSRISAALMWNIVVAISTLLFVMVVAYFLSLKLQKVVSGPILSLAEVAKGVSEKKDYSVRAIKQSNDEVGWLIDTFNEMLEQIQQRDAELVGSKEQLEIKVEERIKDLNCLYSLSKLVEQPEIPLGAIFQETTELIRMAYQYPDFICVRITFNGVKYITDNFDKSELSQHAGIKAGGEKAGDIEVYYLGEEAEAGESPFLQEEGELLDAIAEHLGRIAERTQAGEKLQLFRNLIDRSNDCIFVMKLKWGRFLDVNDKACESLGYTREELLTMSFKDIEESIRDESAWQQQAEELKLKTDLVIEGRHKRKDATTFYAETSLKYVSQDKEEYIIAVARDVTERKKVEEEREKLLEQVESINKELKDFAYIVSHDLKAPLRGIKTLADWIATDYADKLDEEGREQIGLLSGRVVRMHNLIDGVLQYSRVGREKVKRVRVNLNELVSEVIEAIVPPEHIEITVENEMPVVECDETRIMQVFQNLLSTAVKYMDKPQGRIRIGCVQENGFWKFSVSDNGPGIEEAHYEKIFQIFQTLLPRDEVESTGVGLSVVKKIVELYGGRIWVESKPGEGSTFFFTLPKPESEVEYDAKLEANIVS